MRAKKKLTVRESLKEEERMLNRRLTPEQRLIDALELSNICLALKEAVKDSGYKKVTKKSHQRHRRCKEDVRL